MGKMGIVCRTDHNVPRQHWDTIAVWPVLAALMVLGPAPFIGGCAFIQAPEPEATPTPVKDPYKDPNAFQNTTAATKGEMLNDNNAADTSKPEYFRLTQVEAGDLMTLQGIWLTGTTEYIPPHAKPLRVKLVAVYAPRPGEKGWRESADATADWLSNRQLNVEKDPKYPLTADNNTIEANRTVVQITFEAKGKLEKQMVSFNQLLVRSGYAWVDLPIITSLDYKAWIVDEQYARGQIAPPDDKDKQFRVDKNNKPLPPPKGRPVGLWAKGIRRAQQPLATPTPVPATGTGGAPGGEGSSSMSGSGGMGSGSSSGSAPISRAP